MDEPKNLSMKFEQGHYNLIYESCAAGHKHMKSFYLSVKLQLIDFFVKIPNQKS